MPSNPNRGGSDRGGLIYDSRDAISTSKKMRSCSSVGSALATGTGPRKKSKKLNTESEEYDSLNSDSETGSHRELDGITSRTESSNCLDEPGPVSFSSEC